MKWFVMVLVFPLLLNQTLGKQSREIAETQSYLDSQEFMMADEATKRWGAKPFDVRKFKTGKVSERAAMAVDLIRSKSMLGKTPDEIKTLLGDFSGYFWSDRVPAYFVSEGWTEGKDSWQLVFLLDNSAHVNEVRIHKNCCRSGARR